MKQPIVYRKNIPFFYNKTALEFQKDIYENYDSMVFRQTALHLADDLWAGYPMQAVVDFAHQYYPQNANDILEIGCGVGRWIATLAQAYPQASCWGIDYSYQMLRRAHEFWVQGESLLVDMSNKGFPKPLELKGRQLNNLNFGLAKACELPFADNSQDIVLSSFLLDRLDEPLKGLAEMHRVLRANGKLVLISPLNFDQAKHWEQLYPPAKIHRIFTQIGFDVLDWKEELIIEEPLDYRGNSVHWNCIAFVGGKRFE